MNRLVPLAAALALTFALPAHAQVPERISYQGVLTDNLGNIVPDGNYDLTFRIFDVGVAGAALFAETQLGVPVVKGGFNVLIGSVVSLAGLPFDESYWLEVQVNADPPLIPRVRLATSPYAFHLRLPYAGSAAAGAGAALEATNTGAGPDIRATNRLDVGSTTQGGAFNVYNSGANPIAVIDPIGAIGGQLTLNDELGNDFARVEADAHGTGGFLAVMRDAASIGFQVDGNTAATEEPSVSILGTARSAVFNMGVAGTASVVLPSDGIQDTEILDEPGIASVNNNALTNLDGTVQTLLSRTITVPAAGYVVVTATSQMNLSHVNGTATTVQAGISTAAGAFPATQDVGIGVPSGAASGIYFVPGATTAAFFVPAGATTFYYLADELSGSVSVNDPTMTLTYSPTAYGAVSAAKAEEGPAKTGYALTSADIAAEQREAEAFHTARLSREIETMRVQMESIRRQLDESRATQAAAKATAAKPSR